VGRRFQVTPGCLVAGRSLTLIDDYGHHPTEVMAVINTVRDVWPESKLIMVYQPHRYTRTAELFGEFVNVLTLVDELILLDVYPAGEKKIAGATSLDLIKAIEMEGDFKVTHAPEIQDSIDILESVCRSGDIVLIQGAGNVSLVSRALSGQTL
jgi:UDP-N-acetylmuramate--alanine ligase